MERSSAPTADIATQVDRRIWRACAGVSVRVPTLYSRVYYFPEGHVEHYWFNYAFSTNPAASFTLPAVPYSMSVVPCIVSSTELLADRITDEVFTSLQLQPVQKEQFVASNYSMLARDEIEDEENTIVSFAKILTPSDANNGGGFSVPRYCADSIFPPLNYHSDPPHQTLTVRDIHGVVWEFRHIYRGTPRRHLLTTGWSKFVNGKKLIAGDSVVFMKNSEGVMFLGVRRTTIKIGQYNEEFPSTYQSAEIVEEDGAYENKPFKRTGKGKISGKAVSEAMNRAAQGQPFEVVYYPSAGWSDFVVNADDVDAAMNIPWRSGMRVKMARETEDSSRISWFQGTISSTSQETGRGSIWKMLEVTWDEPEILKNVKRVNPWQVELVAPNMFPPVSLPQPKRSKVLQTPQGFMCAEARETIPFITSFTSPAGMQGARHFDSSSANSTGIIEETTPQVCTDNVLDLEVGKVSTKMSIGSPSVDNLSPNTNTNTNTNTTNSSTTNSNQSSGTDPVGNRSSTSSKGKGNSLVLFGKIIFPDSPPNDSDISDGGDGSKSST